MSISINTPSTFSLSGRIQSFFTKAETFVEGLIRKVLPDVFQAPPPSMQLAQITGGTGGRSPEATLFSEEDRTHKTFLFRRFDTPTVNLGHHPEGTIYTAPLSPEGRAPYISRPKTLPPPSPATPERVSMITGDNRAVIASIETSTNPNFYFPDIPGYTILRFLGKGGEASVYEALNPEGHKVAIKHFHTLRGRENHEFFISSLGNDENHRVKALDRLVDEQGHTYAIVFELMQSGTLDDNMATIHQLYDHYYANGNKLGIADLRHVLSRSMQQIADAAVSAHTTGLVHRDLKPENIFMTGNGDILVGDWSSTYTQGHAQPTLVASEGYTAPEVGLLRASTAEGDVYFYATPTYVDANGREVSSDEAEGIILKPKQSIPKMLQGPDGSLIDGALSLFAQECDPNSTLFQTTTVSERTDIFSIGKVYAEMLLGEQEFRLLENQPRAAFIQAVQLACRLWGFDSALATVIAKATEPLPWNRYLSSADLSRALQQALRRTSEGSVRQSDRQTYAHSKSSMAASGIPALDFAPNLEAHDTLPVAVVDSWKEVIGSQSVSPSQPVPSREIDARRGTELFLHIEEIPLPLAPTGNAPLPAWWTHMR